MMRVALRVSLKRPPAWRAAGAGTGWQGSRQGLASIGDDRNKIESEFSSGSESPASRRLSMEAKMRMLRFLDRVVSDKAKKDIEAHNTFSRVPIAEGRAWSYEEFLQADANGDGRVTAAEWEKFCRRKAMMEKNLDYVGPAALRVEIPLSTEQLHAITDEFEGLHINANGMRYRLTLTPEGSTLQIIERKKSELNKVIDELARLETIKRPLDAKAARHTKRVLTGGMFYLLAQAGVIAKLTFYSRFGWDVMEPITYFITFGTAVMGLAFFQYHKIEYSYPALAAMLTRRKAHKVYKKYDFDFTRHGELQALALRLEKQLQMLEPPRSMLVDMDTMAHVDEERERRRSRMENVGLPDMPIKKSASSKNLFSSVDSY